MTRPPQHLAQEGSLVGGGQRDLPVTQLLPQAAVQQAQHQVVGGTGPLGDRDALRLCPTHAPLSTKSRLLPGQPGPSRSLRAASCPRCSCARPWTHALGALIVPAGGPLGAEFTHLWRAGGRTSAAAGTEAAGPRGQSGRGSRGHSCLHPGPALAAGKEDRSTLRPGIPARGYRLLPPSLLLLPRPPSPLTIRDPGLRGQGTPLLALAQLYQVLKAQHGAYAGNVPRVELGNEEQRAGVSSPRPRGPRPPALKKPAVADVQNTETQRGREARRLSHAPGAAPRPGKKGWGTSEATHGARDLGVGQVPEVPPALRAGSHPSVLGLHPHLGHQVEL